MGVGYAFFSAQCQGWVTKILCHPEGVGHVFFEEPGFHFLWPTHPVLFDQPLIGVF